MYHNANISIYLIFQTTIQSDHVMNMESLEINNGSGQAYGYIVYRTHINQGQKLSITDRVYDQAHVSEVKLYPK